MQERDKADRLKMRAKIGELAGTAMGDATGVKRVEEKDNTAMDEEGAGGSWGGLHHWSASACSLLCPCFKLSHGIVVLAFLSSWLLCL